MRLPLLLSAALALAVPAATAHPDPDPAAPLRPRVTRPPVNPIPGADPSFTAVVWIEAYSTGYIWRRDGAELSTDTPDTDARWGPVQHHERADNASPAAGFDAAEFTAGPGAGGALLVHTFSWAWRLPTTSAYCYNATSSSYCGTCAPDASSVNSHGRTEGVWTGRNGTTYLQCRVSRAWNGGV